jgi:hypothetical protein
LCYTMKSIMLMATPKEYHPISVVKDKVNWGDNVNNLTYFSMKLFLEVHLMLISIYRVVQRCNRNVSRSYKYACAVYCKNLMPFQLTMVVRRILSVVPILL